MGDTNNNENDNNKNNHNQNHSLERPMNKTESFKDEAEAFAQIEAKNWHAVTLDIPAESNDFHWHDFDAVVYITKGELVLTVEGMDGPVSCGRGTKINATAGVVHREESKGYSAIIGFAQAPETLTQPINKAPPAAMGQ